MEQSGWPEIEERMEFEYPEGNKSQKLEIKEQPRNLVVTGIETEEPQLEEEEER